MVLRILAFSSSRAGDGTYLQTAAPVIKEFLGAAPLSVAFIPFASVDYDYEVYADKVREGLAGMPHTIKVASPATAKQVIGASDVIMVGGGNTFKLLHDLYSLEVFGVIKHKVENGTPYIGWSAGSNIAGLTIGTTNDMPVIQPQSFKALGFLPFQINPHYYNVVTKGFNGETRDQRLEEFLKMNTDSKIVCLPEGTALQRKGNKLLFMGLSAGVLLTRENEKLSRTEIQPGTELTFLL